MRVQSSVRAITVLGFGAALLLTGCGGGGSHSAVGTGQSNSGQSGGSGVAAYCQDYSDHWSDIENAASRLSESVAGDPTPQPDSNPPDKAAAAQVVPIAQRMAAEASFDSHLQSLWQDLANALGAAANGGTVDGTDLNTSEIGLTTEPFCRGDGAG